MLEGLAATQLRSARINRLVDLIPARFYLNGEQQHLLKSSATLDPARVKFTSQLVAEAAAADTGDTGSPSAPSGGQGNATKKRKKGTSSGTGAQATPADARSRQDLREKLERRISELREERRQQQSAKDKARSEAKWEQRAKSEARPDQPQGNGASTSARGGAGATETGRLIFTPKQSDLPYEASVNRRGNKARQLRASLRDEEVAQRKIREAEAAGHGDEVRRDVAMNKALMRARGEKVHDNTTKIRKSQKVMEKKKIKGKESWKARMEMEKAGAKERQDTRKANLSGRTKKQKGAVELVSGGDGRGFEGKGKGFLNKGD